MSFITTLRATALAAATLLSAGIGQAATVTYYFMTYAKETFKVSYAFDAS